MDAISLTTLAEVVKGQLIGAADDLCVRHASIHSDHIRGETAFFALRGTHAVGHVFVPRALANGAVVAIVSEPVETGGDTGPLIVVDDPQWALWTLAEWWRAQLPARFVAVVGNVGKTVTKDALVYFVGCERPVYGSPGSYNSQIGVPLSILDCPRDVDLAVLEAAATEPGEMGRLAGLIRPAHVVLTNVGTRWESNFSGAAEQARELVGIADGAQWLLVGEADPELRAATAGLATTTWYLDGDPPEYGLDGLTTSVDLPGGERVAVTVRTPSEHIAADVRLAAAAAGRLGVPAATLLEAASEYTPSSARMETWRSPSGLTVVRDIATVDGATFAGAARVAQRLTKPGGRTAVVLADPYERCAEETALALGRTIGRSGVDELCTLDLPVHDSIARGAREVAPSLEVHRFAGPLPMREHLTATLRADDVVLIQSPRERSISELSLSLVEPMAPTRLFIDQSAVESNVVSIRRLIGPQVRLMGMVKALAYGTNPIQLSLTLEAAGVDALAVAAVDEGVALRRAGVSLDTVLVLLSTGAELERMARNRLTPLVYSPDLLRAAVRHAERAGPLGGLSGRRPPLSIHLEVDSGMHRTGLSPDEAKQALRELRDVPSIHLAGLMTHFSCADMPGMDDFTLRQLAVFEDVVAVAHDLGFSDFVRHAANTAATMRLPSTRLDMVRVGIGLFGIYPSPETAPYAKLTPAISLVGKIVEIHDLGPGEFVGYGATYRTPEGGARIGVVSAGYHDCVPRAFSNHGSVAVNGQVCPIAGTVSMDSMTIDLTNCPDATIGTDVIIYGGQGASSVSIEEVAAQFGTIPYELLAARIGPRVQRVFTRH